MSEMGIFHQVQTLSSALSHFWFKSFGLATRSSLEPCNFYQIERVWNQCTLWTVFSDLSTRSETTPVFQSRMRQRAVQIILLAAVFSVPLFAQKVELFGGAQYEHLQPSYNAVGWDASLTGNFRHILGITGDVSGVYHSHRINSSLYTYTFGPVLTARLPVVQPFVHALFGGATMSRAGVNDSTFAMFIGGGLDIGLRKGIGLRLVQADWLMTQFRDETQDRQGRVSAGLMIKF